MVIRCTTSRLTTNPGSNPIVYPMHGRAPTLTRFPANLAFSKTVSFVRTTLRTYVSGIGTNVEKKLRTFVTRIASFVSNGKEIRVLGTRHQQSVALLLSLMAENTVNLHAAFEYARTAAISQCSDGRRQHTGGVGLFGGDCR